MELLVVIAVIGLLAAVSYPTLGKVQQREQVRQVAENLANLIRSAQEQTLSEQYIYGVIIDSVNDTASLIYYGESYEGQLNYETKETITVDTNKADIDSTTIVDGDTGAAIIRYSRSGQPSTTGTTEIDSANGNYSWQVEVSPSGSVKVSSL